MSTVDDQSSERGDAAVAAQLSPKPSIGILSPSDCKSRYGVAYLRAICSQAGVGFMETPSDEDREAIDGMIKFRGVVVLVQVKCTSQFKIAGHSATWPAKPEWREAWQSSLLPVYFVLVIMDVQDRDSWLLHDGKGTMHRAAAFWTRVDQAGSGNINVPKTQRLTAQTMELWADEAFQRFVPIEGVR